MAELRCRVHQPFFFSQNVISKTLSAVLLKYALNIKSCGLTDGELLQYLRSCILTDGELLQYLKSCILTFGELLQYLKHFGLRDGELYCELTGGELL